jgi:predicted porin
VFTLTILRVYLVKKTIIATAVATALTAGLTTASANGLYGNIRLGLQSADELDVASNKLVFGFKGSEDLGNGMDLGFGIEFERDNADAEGTGISNDKSWISLGGGFGKVIIGEHSDMAGWACGATDILYWGTAEACSLGNNTSPSNAIQYRGGAGAISFGAAMTFNGSGDSGTLLGFQYAADNFAIGMQTTGNGDGVADVSGDGDMQLGGHYMMGDITLGFTMANDSSDETDESAMDFSLQMPVGAGSIAVVVSQADDAYGYDSTDFLYSQGVGKAGYAGLEYNQADGQYAGEDSRITAFIGTSF